MAEIFLPRGAEEVLLAFEQDRYMGRPTLANYLNICVRTVDSLPLKRYRINSKVLFKKSKVDAYIGTAGVKRPPLTPGETPPRVGVIGPYFQWEEEQFGSAQILAWGVASVSQDEGAGSLNKDPGKRRGVGECKNACGMPLEQTVLRARRCGPGGPGLAPEVLL